MTDARHSSQSSAIPAEAKTPDFSSSMAHRRKAVASRVSSFYRLPWLATWAVSFLLSSSLMTWRCSALTLQWDAPTTTNILGFRLYQSVGTAPFVAVTNLGPTTRTVTWPESATELTRFYIVSTPPSPPYPSPESDPSNVITNTPPAPPPTGTVSLSKPTLSTNNVVQGTALGITAKLTNAAASAFVIQSGSIVLLAPGATQVSGPYVYAASISAQTVAAGTTATFTATWPTTTATAVGAWLAYIVIQDSGGTWTAGPQAPFSVVSPPTTPLPPVAPTNLRVVKITSTRLDIAWNSDLTAITKVERSIDSAPFGEMETLPAGAQHTSTTFSKRRRYAFRARSLNSIGSSGYSNLAYFESR